MKIACLINNYNYADFIVEAVDSVCGKPSRSTKSSSSTTARPMAPRELLARKYGQNPRVRIVAKQNQGQLSCFNAGFARSTSDILFFLDADDVYEPNYVEQSLAVYRRDSTIDFVFCGHRQFGEQDGLQLKYAADRDLGYSAILTAYLHEWIGAPTSCLSMRRTVLEKILPLPFLEAWRTRADDCLVFGASLAGARKYFLAQPSVRYRVHPRNHFFGRKIDRGAIYRRRLAINALFEHLENKLSYNVDRFGEFHHREFCTIDEPTFRELKKYLAINARLPNTIGRRLKGFGRIDGPFSPRRDSAHLSGSGQRGNSVSPPRHDFFLARPSCQSEEPARHDRPPTRDEGRGTRDERRGISG